MQGFGGSWCGEGDRRVRLGGGEAFCGQCLDGELLDRKKIGKGSLC